MPAPEQQPQEPFENMPPQERPEQEQFRTIAVRVEESMHAQLRFIAQLGRTSLAEEIRAAIEQRIATAQDDPDLMAKAEAARLQIEREAAERAAAIAGFMGQKATRAASPNVPIQGGRRPRGGNTSS